MNPFLRHKNTVVLATVLLAQLLALAVQVKRQTAEGPVRVIRLVAVSTIAPFERLFIYSGETVRGVWANYIDLRGVRRENQRLKAETDQMRLQSAREQEDARQARRIQALLQFKEQWIDTTVAAQVIGTSGTESSRLLYLDKGTKDGIKADMPVITPDGIVGKVLAVYGETSQVLMISDPTSGVGATLVNLRLQGIVKGTSTGEVQLDYIMGDEPVKSGEPLVTSGGDRVFPKGLPIGTVAQVSMGRNLFLEIKLKPAVDLNRLEEVLVITEQKPRAPDTAGLGPIRASDILAQHLPGVPQTPPPGAAPQQQGQSAPGGQPVAGASVPAQSAAQKTLTAKPASAVTPAAGASPAKPQAVKPTGTNVAKPPTAKPAGINASATTGTAKTIQKPATGATAAAGSNAAKPQAVKPAGTNVGKPPTAKPAGGNASTNTGTAKTIQKPATGATAAAGSNAAKPQTVKPAGANVAKPQAAKPAGANAGAIAGTVKAVQKTPAPKPATKPTTTKLVAPNATGPKPKPLASEGTHAQ
jgi:rod shape-determining protein MreC